MLIEFETTDGKSVWAGAGHIVSITTRANFAGDDLTVVKLSDGTELHAAESARALGSRIIDATGMHLGASLHDLALLRNPYRAQD